VAFLIEDAYQGHGLAQLLLEHLAEAARELGYSRFVAEVLPNNVRMIQVFRDQGYRVAGALADGVMTLEFPIDPTDTSASNGDAIVAARSPSRSRDVALSRHSAANIFWCADECGSRW
jgi:GNAT superfamily N-acetyltransferase